LEELAGGSDALEGGFEDVLGVGFCVDDQGRGIGEVGLEWAVTIACERVTFVHCNFLF
jgi:hypothetical protein